MYVTLFPFPILCTPRKLEKLRDYPTARRCETKALLKEALRTTLLLLMEESSDPREEHEYMPDEGPLIFSNIVRTRSNLDENDRVRV